MHGYVNGPPTPPASPPPFDLDPRIGTYIGAGSSLQLKAVLGTGAYGVVYLAYDHRSGTPFAVKALSKTTPNGQQLDHRQQDFQNREIRLHYEASAHPNVVSMHRIVEEEDCTYVVLEYCPEGDLFSNITEKGRYVGNDFLVRSTFLQILDAVAHCHHYGIFHRDLKPENILVSNSGSKVLLADFGLATKDQVSDDHGCGSTFYMSPECLDQSSRNTAYRCAPNDIWSLGVILVNLTCGRNPWKQASTLDSTYRAFARDSNFLKTILPLSVELNRILGMIFECNPEQRITIDELREEILRCPTFTAPPAPVQTVPVQRSSRVLPLSPPTSVPSSPELYPQPDLQEIVKQSIASMDVCLSGSARSASSSGSSDPGYGSDSGSDLSEPDFDVSEQAPPPKQQQQRLGAHTIATPQAYVLPSQEYSQPWVTPASTKPAQQQWSQPWAFGYHDGYQYEQHYSSPIYHVPQYQSIFNPYALHCPAFY